MVGYQDDGKFFVYAISNQGEVLTHLDVSELLELDDESKSLDGFYEPLITAIFLTDDIIRITVYHRVNRTQIHCNFDLAQDEKVGEVGVVSIADCNNMNFVLKSFFRPAQGDILNFYRQGQCVICNAWETAESRLERVTDSDFGSMFLLYDKALIVRSSSNILFFKEHPETGLWTQYHKLSEMRGQIFFIKGNVRIQVTTPELIYFFLIDRDTLLPKLENVMKNFMDCSQMMFGARVRYGVSYKINQPGFTIYTRKYYHNFKIITTTANHEGACGANIETGNCYALANGLTCNIHDQVTLEILQNLPVPSRNENSQVLFIKTSHDDSKLGLIVGEEQIKNTFNITDLVIYKRNEAGAYELQKHRDFEFKDACPQFEFNKRNNQEILMFTQEEVCIIDYMQEHIEMR